MEATGRTGDQVGEGQSRCLMHKRDRDGALVTKPTSAHLSQSTSLFVSAAAYRPAAAPPPPPPPTPKPDQFVFPSIAPDVLKASLSSSGAVQRPLPGLRNLGNTCFLNSVLQCLCHTPVLVAYLLGGSHTRRCKNSHSRCTTCAFSRHLSSVMNSKERAVAPRPITDLLKEIGRRFRVGRQEDAHEFLRLLLDSFQRVELRLLKLKESDPRNLVEATFVHNIFGGYFRNQLKCKSCGYASNTYEAFLDLSVELPKSVTNILDLLGHFTKPEVLDDRNKWKCDGCKSLVCARKKLSIHKAPAVLTIQLKRFSFLHLYGGKISRPIQFAEDLDLGPFMSDAKNKEHAPVMYDLFGVVVHQGADLHSGHYYSYIKTGGLGWVAMDDSEVSPVTFHTVKREPAYVLMYARRVPKGKSPHLGGVLTSHDAVPALALEPPVISVSPPHPAPQSRPAGEAGWSSSSSSTSSTPSPSSDADSDSDYDESSVDDGPADRQQLEVDRMRPRLRFPASALYRAFPLPRLKRFQGRRRAVEYVRACPSPSGASVQPSLALSTEPEPSPPPAVWKVPFALPTAASDSESGSLSEPDIQPSCSADGNTCFLFQADAGGHTSWADFAEKNEWD